MDKNRKLIIIGVATLLIIVAIVGTLISRRTGTPRQSTEEVELTYIGLWESKNIIQPLIDEFEEEYPNIKVTYIQDRVTQYEENMYGRLSDPELTPDIIRIHNTWTYKFEPLLSPLPPEILTQTEYSNTFYPTALDDFMGRDGNIYAIPLMVDGMALFYNKDLFSKKGISTPPEDWDTFREYAERLTEKTPGGIISEAGAAIGCSSNIYHAPELLSALMLQSKIDMTSSDQTQVVFNTTRAAAVLDYYASFVTENGVWSCELMKDLEMFSAGRLAMMFAPSWRVFDVIKMNPSINFGTSELPQLVGNDADINYSSYWGEAVSAQSKHQLEAWQFVKFMSEKEQQKSMYALASQERTFGEPYSRKDLASEISSTPYVGPYILMAPTMKSWKWGDETTAKQALNTAITEVVERKNDAESALSTATSTINLKLSEIYRNQ